VAKAEKMGAAGIILIAQTYAYLNKIPSNVAVAAAKGLVEACKPIMGKVINALNEMHEDAVAQLLKNYESFDGKVQEATDVAKQEIYQPEDESQQSIMPQVQEQSEQAVVQKTVKVPLKVRQAPGTTAQVKGSKKAEEKISLTNARRNKDGYEWGKLAGDEGWVATKKIDSNKDYIA
jgi:hypothetical protein